MVVVVDYRQNGKTLQASTCIFLYLFMRLRSHETKKTQCLQCNWSVFFLPWKPSCFWLGWKLFREIMIFTLKLAWEKISNMHRRIKSGLIQNYRQLKMFLTVCFQTEKREKRCLTARERSEINNYYCLFQLEIDNFCCCCCWKKANRTKCGITAFCCFSLSIISKQILPTTECKARNEGDCMNRCNRFSFNFIFSFFSLFQWNKIVLMFITSVGFTDNKMLVSKNDSTTRRRRGEEKQEKSGKCGACQFLSSSH